MTEIIGRLVLWTVAIGAVVFYMNSDTRRKQDPLARIGGGPGIIGILGAALFMLLLAGCAGPPIVTAMPNSCATLLPSEWKNGVAGAPLPDGDTVGDWVSFADQQTGKLDIANDHTKSAIGIVERCEARDAAAIKKATRGFFGRLFG